MTPRSHRATPQPSRRRPTVLAASVAVTAALTLSGCQWTSPLQTRKDYDPADGVSAAVGQVQLRNILIVAGQSGGPGTLVAWAENPGTAPVTLTFTAGQNEAISLAVPAGGSAQLGGAGQRPASLKAVASPPGATTSVSVATGAAGAVAVNVPVLYPFEESPYRTLAPEGFTPSPEPTRTPQAGPTH